MVRRESVAKVTGWKGGGYPEFAKLVGLPSSTYAQTESRECMHTFIDS